MNAEQYAGVAAEFALAQVADHAHVLSGAWGARPNGSDGARTRPAGVTLAPPRTDPAVPAVFTAMCSDRVCAGRFDQRAGGIAGGRVARRTDIDLLVYLAELASRPQDEWQPFFEFFSPRHLADETGPGRIVWGEDCRGRRHFDAIGLIVWCLEQAVDSRYPIAFDAADPNCVSSVPLSAPPRPGDLVFADRSDGDTGIGMLVDSGTIAADSHPAHVVVATQTTVGVVRIPYVPEEWTRRGQPGPDLLHD
ncbi:hypothetical protein ACWEKT_38850 [Nocardia takedensis]|uniref:hypothetical protein n=1 Tax=Nocardia takedensis TaxID=259390 RepID=UPI0012F6CD3C|nr:hypothetical protein [Nocardia takedensis]